jgi:hypothetical protein
MNPAHYPLYLANDGAQWTGTFTLTAQTLLDDLLSDGEPVTVDLHVMDETGRNEQTFRGVQVATATGDGITFTGGGTVEWDQLFAVGVK